MSDGARCKYYWGRLIECLEVSLDKRVEGMLAENDRQIQKYAKLWIEAELAKDVNKEQ